MYPTLEQVEQADRMTLAGWYRFLPSPGSTAIGKPEFSDVLEKEAKVMTRLVERFRELGGMTPQISKTIGLGS